MKNRLIILGFLVCLIQGNAFSQDEGELTDNARATLILDIARYVEYDDTFDELKEFSITIIDNNDDFYWTLDDMASQRKFIQGKPVRIYLVPKASMLRETQVIYLNKDKGIKSREVLKEIEGKNTLLISEGYEFRETMINFLVVDGQPRFDANEEMMNKHRLEVDALFLAQAIKTREDWEQLYDVKDVELQEEKEITAQQLKQIAKQDSMISIQLQKLENLGKDIRAKETELTEKIDVLAAKESEIIDKESEISHQQEILDKNKNEILLKSKQLSEQQTDIEKKAKRLEEQSQEIKNRDEEIADRDSKIAVQLETIHKQKIVTIASIIALLMMVILAYLIWVNYRNKKKANQLLETKNRQITIQKEEILRQKDLAENQRDQIAYQKKHITDSIHYAQKIQRAILPSLQLFSAELEHFVLYKPRDIVSGDFYWVDHIDNKQIIVTADCTGHGVPGAFMSMLGVSLLNEIILNRKILEPHKILCQLRKMIIESLNQKDDGAVIKDGMDMTITVIDFNKNLLQYSGANNPLFLIRNGELMQYKADKMPVAIHEVMNDFTLIDIDLQEGDTFYTFSDGFVDQFGGPKQKKFLTKNFKRVLLELQDMHMMDQGHRLDQIFEEYKGEIEQIDDVVVIGVRYK